jgi:hypothetical protein
MVGVSFFMLCTNYYLTSNKLLRENKEISAGKVIQVEQKQASNQQLNSAGYPVTYETYLKLTENKGDNDQFKVLHSSFFIESVFNLNLNQVYDFVIYFMDDNLFQYLYGFQRKEGVAYLGNIAYQNFADMEEFMKAERDNGLVFIGPQISFANDSMTFNHQEYAIQVVMPSEAHTIMPGYNGEEGFDMEAAVILPIEDEFLPLSSAKSTDILARSVTFFQYLTDNWREDLVEQKLEIMNAANAEISFEVSDTYLVLKNRMVDYNYDMNQWFLVAVSIIILTGIGCIGSMFLILEKRRFFMAIAMAVGSTRRRLMQELAAELFAIFSIGAFVGILSIPFFQNFLASIEFLEFHYIGIIVIICLTCILSILPVLLVFKSFKINKLNSLLQEG